MDEFRREEFRTLGFRCLDAVEVRLLDGTTAIVKASIYRQSNEREDDTPRQRRALRCYSVVQAGKQAIKLVDEFELEALLGTSAFNELLS